MGQDYSELRCGFTSDGKLKAEFKAAHADGSASASSAVGTSEKFASRVVMKHPSDLKLENSVIDVSESDIGGKDRLKSILAGTEQKNLKHCEKQFPSF